MKCYDSMIGEVDFGERSSYFRSFVRRPDIDCGYEVDAIGRKHYYNKRSSHWIGNRSCVENTPIFLVVAPMRTKDDMDARKYPSVPIFDFLTNTPSMRTFCEDLALFLHEMNPCVKALLKHRAKLIDISEWVESISGRFHLLIDEQDSGMTSPDPNLSDIPWKSRHLKKMLQKQCSKDASEQHQQLKSDLVESE